MISINEYLDNVLKDFKQYVGSEKNLCALKGAHFDGGKVPDYSDKHIQQLYLLRYAYAYAFEYKCMYSYLMDKRGLENKVKVTSIGCGSLIDYWSLVHAVSEDYNICYRGIDIIDWAYKVQPRTCDDVDCVVGDAIKLLQGADSFSSDIFIFPKSISELLPDEVSTLAVCFSGENGKKLLKNKVHFLFSLRTDPGSIVRDMSKTQIIYDRMLACGFHTSDKSNQYLGFNESIKGKNIRNIDDDFAHPGNVVDFLKDLYERCEDIETCQEKEDCKGRLGRWPILKCRYATWQIFTFER